MTIRFASNVRTREKVYIVDDKYHATLIETLRYYSPHYEQLNTNSIPQLERRTRQQDARESL